MILDFHPSTGCFTLRVMRHEADPTVLMKEHGLDFSLPDSRGGEAVMFTRDPYGAAVFKDVATPYAYAQIAGIVSEVEASWSKSNDAIYRVPADKELWPFQKADLAYALRRRNTLVGDQPGLGKTPVAICFANEIRAKRVLVICPANIRLQWATRVREWSTQRWPYVVYPILNSSKGVHPSAEWTIVSFDLARTPAIGAALAKGHYDLLIIDEAHYAKNNDSLRCRALFGGGQESKFEPLANRSERVLALTGTPLPNRPREAYTLTRGLCWDAIDWMSEQTFRDRYNPSERIKGQRKLRDGTGNVIGMEDYFYVREEAGRHAELQNRLRGNYMVRHEKHGPNGVMGQLKLPVYDIVLVDETEAVKQALAAEKMLDIDPDDEGLFQSSDAKVMGDIAVVRHMMGIAIAPLAAEYIAMLLDGGEEKIAVFGWHIDVMNYLQHKLEKYGVVRIDGAVTPKRKQKLIDDFRTEPKIRGCLGNLQSIGTGTDGMQDVCSRAVFPEFSWVPGENQQCVDRLDRGGQVRTVLADFLVAKGSLGERILASSLRKLQSTTKVLDQQLKWA